MAASRVEVDQSKTSILDMTSARFPIFQDGAASEYVFPFQRFRKNYQMTTSGCLPGAIPAWRTNVEDSSQGSVPVSSERIEFIAAGISTKEFGAFNDRGDETTLLHARRPPCPVFTRGPGLVPNP
jgi:hypothetical protein